MNKEIDIKEINELIEKESAFIDMLLLEVNKVIIGQKHMMERLLIGLLGQGHILLEGVPGLAKTLAINSLSKAVKGSFSRIQFTPDLLPADVVGTMIYNMKENDFSIKKGPIFANFVLADEINRAPAKVQSALLESMQERQVTIGDSTFKLTPPFLVMATQNPVEQEGTYPLPEAQRDRFLFQIIVDYPTREEERQIVEQTTSTFESKLEPVIDGPSLIECQETVRKVPVPDHVYDFVLELVRSARPKEENAAAWVKDLIDWGPGPRACQQLILGAKVRALLNGRFHAKIEDVTALAHPVLRHRIVPTFNAEAEGISVDSLIDRLIEEVPTKKETVL